MEMLDDATEQAQIPMSSCHLHVVHFGGLLPHCLNCCSAYWGVVMQMLKKASAQGRVVLSPFWP